MGCSAWLVGFNGTFDTRQVAHLTNYSLVKKPTLVRKLKMFYDKVRKLS